MLPDVRPTHGRYGVALVEIALVLPVFLAIVGGVAAFGRAASLTQAVHDAARLGARRAAEPSATNASVKTTVENSLQAAAGLSAEQFDLSIRIEPASGNPDPQQDLARANLKDRITVAVAVPSERAGWLAGTVLQTATLRGEYQSRRE